MVAPYHFVIMGLLEHYTTIVKPLGFAVELLSLPQRNSHTIQRLKLSLKLIQEEKEKNKSWPSQSLFKCLDGLESQHFHLYRLLIEGREAVEIDSSFSSLLTSMGQLIRKLEMAIHRKSNFDDVEEELVEKTAAALQLSDPEQNPDQVREAAKNIEFFLNQVEYAKTLCNPLNVNQLKLRWKMLSPVLHNLKLAAGVLWSPTVANEVCGTLQKLSLVLKNNALIEKHGHHDLMIYFHDQLEQVITSVVGFSGLANNKGIKATYVGLLD